MGAALLTSCEMENPLLSESPLEYGAPQFDKIQNKHYLPAFEQAIKDAKAEIDAIVNNPDAPTFANTIEALEYSGETLENVASIFYNLMEADTNEEMQNIAEKVAPMMTEFSMYVSLNEKLFEKVKAVYDARESLGLEPDQMRLLEKKYLDFTRGGANLNAEDKATYSKLSEEESLLELAYGKNLLAATNAFTLDLTDEAELEGLPEYVVAMGKQTAADKGKEGWVFDLSYPSYSAFMKYSLRRDLREKMYRAYNSKALGGEFDNTQNVKDIAGHRIAIANILGYPTWADYQLEKRMVKKPADVDAFIKRLLDPSLPAARKDVEAIYKFAKQNGFADKALMPWDFSFWSEKYKAANYQLDETELKPYFQLESCIDAVFGLATKLYGLSSPLVPTFPAITRT